MSAEPAPPKEPKKTPLALTLILPAVLAGSAAFGGAKVAAAGGGPDKVWVNTDSKVYHCPADKWYGKTKQGEYMTEADATAKGFRADHNKPCK